ncbi:MAG: type II secretion system protein [Lachnospiraceae bacterium]|nr:type II secretion system protein [Lachnospiraceae bacterium]MBP5565431.1 type II secretion system protein [Lachnospiraceae bacterium]
MKSNKGFSLIELIIVIAIMAILVGVSAPILIRQIEKTNVSSDIQLCDTIHTAVTYAIVDTKVLQDPNSQPFLDQMATSGMNIDDTAFLSSSCVLKDSITDYIGCPLSDVKSKVKSQHGSGCECVITTINDQVTVTFTETDIRAKRDTSSSTPDNDIYID